MWCSVHASHNNILTLSKVGHQCATQLRCTKGNDLRASESIRIHLNAVFNDSADHSGETEAPW